MRKDEAKAALVESSVKSGKRIDHDNGRKIWTIYNTEKIPSRSLRVRYSTRPRLIQLGCIEEHAPPPGKRARTT